VISPHRTLSVLLVTGAYYPEISSGGLQCQAVARALRDRVDVEVLTTAVDASLPQHEIVDGVPVTRIAVDVRSRWSKARAARRMVGALLSRLRRVDLVHIHGFSRKNVLVTAMARLLGVPVVMSLHTAGFDEPDAIAAQGRVTWWAFAHADLYLSVSPQLMERYLASGLPASKIRQVPNGIDLQRFAPATDADRQSLRRQLGLPPASPIILFVGFFSREKQPRVLFDAWRTLTDTPLPALVLVGATRSSYFEVDQTIADRMRRDAAEAGAADRLFFVDPTHRIHDYFRAADLFALPSSREGLPVALLEAMACGLPCVASRLAGATDVIITHGEDGILVPPGDADALASALASLLRDHACASRIGAHARATVVSRFANTEVAERWLDAYETLVRGTAA
jgi:glycosyltransferase involved in cell wall biosynthesis